MRRFGIAGTVVAALLLLASTAAAANPAFKHGGEPTLTDNGKTLTLNAAMTGLGNGDLVVKIDWTGTTINNTCTSPGGNAAPGQNPATPVSGSSDATIKPDKNGNVKITLTPVARTRTGRPPTRMSSSSRQPSRLTSPRRASTPRARPTSRRAAR